MKAKKLIRYRIPVSVKFPATHPRRGEKTHFIDKGYLEIAKSLMMAILYDNGYIDRWHSEESQFSTKWQNKIAPFAGRFFDLHPELLTDNNINVLSMGSDECDGSFDGLENYEGFNELSDILNKYYDDGCGIPCVTIINLDSK